MDFSTGVNLLVAVATLGAAVATAVSAAATAKSAKEAAVSNDLARREVAEARAEREAEEAPRVLVYPEMVGEGKLRLIIENVGKTMAVDISASFTPELKPDYQGWRGTFPFVSPGIKTLAPGQRLVYGLGYVRAFVLGNESSSHGKPSEYDVTLSWQAATRKKKYVEQQTIDMRMFSYVNFEKES